MTKAGSVFLIIYQVYKYINNLVTTFVRSLQAEGGRGLLSGGLLSLGASVREGFCQGDSVRGAYVRGAYVRSPFSTATKG